MGEGSDEESGNEGEAELLLYNYYLPSKYLLSSKHNRQGPWVPTELTFLVLGRLGNGAFNQ